MRSSAARSYISRLPSPTVRPPSRRTSCGAPSASRPPLLSLSRKGILQPSRSKPRWRRRSATSLTPHSSWRAIRFRVGATNPPSPLRSTCSPVRVKLTIAKISPQTLAGRTALMTGARRPLSSVSARSSLLARRSLRSLRQGRPRPPRRGATGKAAQVTRTSGANHRRRSTASPTRRSSCAASSASSASPLLHRQRRRRLQAPYIPECAVWASRSWPTTLANLATPTSSCLARLLDRTSWRPSS
jgi:hypothetical protein